MPVAAIREFFKLESAGGICLFFAAVVAIILDNSALAPFYDGLLSVPVAVKNRRTRNRQTVSALDQ